HWLATNKVTTLFVNAIDNFARAIFNFGGNVATWIKGTRLWQSAPGVAGRVAGGVSKFAGKAGSAILNVADTGARAVARGGKALAGTRVGAGAIKAVQGTARSLAGLGKAGVFATRGLATAIKATTSWSVVIPAAIYAI